MNGSKLNKGMREMHGNHMKGVIVRSARSFYASSVNAMQQSSHPS